jgi:retron-type reverse transcriptase
MKTVKMLNEKDFPIENWDVSQIRLNEMFEYIENLTIEEKRLAISMMNRMNIDYIDDYIIELYITPAHLMNFIVFLNRSSKRG